VGKNVQLTEEVVVAADRGKVIRTLVLAAMVLVGLNLIARPFLDRFTTNRSTWLIRKKWRLVEDLDQPVDWLALGDSSCNQGLRPDVLAPRLGGRVLNTCTIGDMLVVNDAWMLERHIARVGPPKNVVIVHVYDMWHRSSSVLRKSLLGGIPLPWGFWEKLTPTVELAEADRKAMFLKRYVPLYAENLSLGQAMVHPEGVGGQGFAIDAEGYMRSDVVNPAAVRTDAAQHRRFLASRSFAFSKENRAALDEILRLAEVHGFEVYVASSPLYAEVSASAPFQRYYAELLKQLRKLGSRSPRLHLVLEEPVTFPAERMENADHLDHQAAAIYSERLADAVLAARRSGGAEPVEPPPAP
jgi:hypothetical protein